MAKEMTPDMEHENLYTTGAHRFKVRVEFDRLNIKGNLETHSIREWDLFADDKKKAMELATLMLYGDEPNVMAVRNIQVTSLDTPRPWWKTWWDHFCGKL